VPFVGRALAEYEQSFALDVPALKGRDVLDVGAGPSSFTAEAAARRIDAVAVDPRYGDPGGSLRAQVEQDYARAGARARTPTRPFRPSGFPWSAAVAPDRRGAAERFLQDYETHFVHGRYVAGSLPQLPFFDGTFDLVLCGHLLFTAPARFGFDWHVAACRELVRVSADTVRIYPLCALDGRTYPGLARLRRELRATGLASQVTGDGDLLVLRRAAP
jgi:SAM-dependent methyltransferase